MWSKEEKEQVIKNGGLVRKDEWDRWSDEEKREWFENMKKRTMKKSSPAANQSWIPKK